MEVSKVTCIECGSQMKTGRENFKYDASGLRGITLADVEVARCATCGEFEVTIPNIEGLHRAIALAICNRKERLTPEEVRFLRKYLGLSGVDFAEILGVAAESVSRWETGKAAMGGTADRYLRLLVLTRQPVSHYPLEMLRTIATEEAKPLKLGLRADDAGWHPTRQRELQPA